MQEVAEVLAASYLQRSHHSGARTAGVRLMDRGMPMLEASIAATAAVRENLTPEQAADKAGDLLEPYARDVKAAEVGECGIVLLHHERLHDRCRGGWLRVGGGRHGSQATGGEDESDCDG